MEEIGRGKHFSPHSFPVLFKFAIQGKNMLFHMRNSCDN